MEGKYYPCFIFGTQLDCSVLLVYSGNLYKRDQLHLDCQNLSAVATRPSSGVFISSTISNTIYKKLLRTFEHLTDKFGAIRVPNSVGSFDNLSVSAGLHISTMVFCRT